MFCPYCGNNCGEGAAFCPNCGQPLQAPAAPQPPVNEYQTPAAPYQAPAQPAANARDDLGVPAFLRRSEKK